MIEQPRIDEWNKRMEKLTDEKLKKRVSYWVEKYEAIMKDLEQRHGPIPPPDAL